MKITSDLPIAHDDDTLISVQLADGKLYTDTVANLASGAKQQAAQQAGLYE
ncbi:hypothetical protein SEA_JUNG_73 [Mycobacterium phage Jung]|uniref:Uncharacterized protein n=2 Tax=Fishburnevirus TaxID=1983734 RepID=A0A222ZKQ1_9CAUD|nr:hypothetical protein I5J41_gp73 [Mycobacterium phage Jung]ASR84929.1 hypothetical protein SEA_STEVIERAY_77 [Mycobacterium phage StevieRay]QKY80229.1 hypothetical protein SEA_JUNG_73 [Mycobacterium phage Jung]